MVDFPFAWVSFIVFILCTSFTVLNLFIGIIVSAMQSEHEDSANKDRELLMARQEHIIRELEEIRRVMEQRN
jgi:voltage-gated sodium channel